MNPQSESEERIKACVAACEGISTPELEPGILNRVWLTLDDQQQAAIKEQPARGERVVQHAPREDGHTVRSTSTDKQERTPRTDAWVAQTVNDNPLIMSLLYDIDLLPEQIKEGDERRYGYMLAVIGHMKAAQSASGAISGDEEIAALFRKRDALENPLSADEVDEQIDSLLRKQFMARRAAASSSAGKGEG